VTAGPAAPLLIGLVGPIGCGKSTVAGWLAERGGRVIDADAVAREVTAPGQPGHEAILQRFGDAFRRPDGTLDRGALGRHVFADPAALAELERIVHPLVRPRILAALADARTADVPVVALEAIKLVEAGYAAMCDEVWLIACPPEDQQRRLVARGLSAHDAAQRAAAQAGMAETLARVATRVLDTHGSLAEVHARVDAALDDALARRRDAGSEEGARRAPNEPGPTACRSGPASGRPRPGRALPPGGSGQDPG
jgi:dephospho-CoA kinase